MSSRKSQPVNVRKDSRADRLHVGTITTEQLRKMRKSSERDARIEAGVRQSGTGVHGGGKRERNRRDRKQWKLDLKSGS